MKILPKYLGESKTGSYLYEIRLANERINNAHPEDAEVQIAQIKEQEIVIFDE